MSIFSLFTSKPKKLLEAFTEGNDRYILDIIQHESNETLFDPHLSIKNKDYLFTHHAAICGLDSIFRICCLKSSEFILKSLNSAGQTILHCICQKCNHKNHCLPENKLKCLMFFIDYYSELGSELINKQDNSGCTALHYLVKSDQSYLCEKLLSIIGINREIKDNYGQSANDWCIINNNHKMRKIIKYYNRIGSLRLQTSFAYTNKDKINDITNSLDIPPNFSKELLKSYTNMKSLFYNYYHHNIKIPNSMECKICCNKSDIYEFFWVKCNHSYCKSCWKNYLITKLKEGESELKCMKDNCNMKLTMEDIKGLGGEVMKMYKKNIEREIMKQEKNLIHCPYPKCNEVVYVCDERLNDMYYLECKNHHKFCGLCFEKPHIPCSCDERREFTELLSQMKIQNNKFDEESEEYEENEDITKAVYLINNTTKFCPKCHVRIEKNRGCNHMKCVNCNHEFCWLCLGPWSIHGQATGGFYECNREHEKAEAKNMIRKEKMKYSFKYLYSKYLSIKEKRDYILFFKKNKKVRELIEEIFDTIMNCFIFISCNVSYTESIEKIEKIILQLTIESDLLEADDELEINLQTNLQTHLNDLLMIRNDIELIRRNDENRIDYDDEDIENLRLMNMVNNPNQRMFTRLVQRRQREEQQREQRQREERLREERLREQQQEMQQQLRELQQLQMQRELRELHVLEPMQQLVHIWRSERNRRLLTQRNHPLLQPIQNPPGYVENLREAPPQLRQLPPRNNPFHIQLDLEENTPTNPTQTAITPRSPLSETMLQPIQNPPEFHLPPSQLLHNFEY